MGSHHFFISCGHLSTPSSSLSLSPSASGTSPHRRNQGSGCVCLCEVEVPALWNVYVCVRLGVPALCGMCVLESLHCGVCVCVCVASESSLITVPQHLPWVRCHLRPHLHARRHFLPRAGDGWRSSVWFIGSLRRRARGHVWMFQGWA